jgi:hypothetical protein
MSEHKHTPGPWFRDQYGHVYGWEPTEYGQRSVLLIDNRHSKATSADKSLIAAAPELLEALKDVMERLVDRHEADESAVKARAAITKATGDQS